MKLKLCLVAIAREEGTRNEGTIDRDEWRSETTKREVPKGERGVWTGTKRGGRIDYSQPGVSFDSKLLSQVLDSRLTKLNENPFFLAQGWTEKEREKERTFLIQKPYRIENHNVRSSIVRSANAVKTLNHSTILEVNAALINFSTSFWYKNLKEVFSKFCLHFELRNAYSTLLAFKVQIFSFFYSTNFRCFSFLKLFSCSLNLASAG